MEINNRVMVLIPAYMPGDRLIKLCRQLDGKVPLRRKLGNLFTKWVFAASSGKLIQDTQTGLRGFPFRMIPDLLAIQGEK